MQQQQQQQHEGIEMAISQSVKVCQPFHLIISNLKTLSYQRMCQASNNALTPQGRAPHMY